MSYPATFDRIFARNCEVRHIDKQTAAQFLDRCHKYGDASCRHRYGLFVSRYSGSENKDTFEGEHKYPIGALVAVGEFSNARKWQKGEKEIRSYEWTRYASLPETRVLGGMGRILEYFIKEVKPDDIMSYSPKEHYDGETYLKLGFTLEGEKSFGEKTSLKYRLKLTDY